MTVGSHTREEERARASSVLPHRPRWWVLPASFWLVFSQGPLRVRLCVIYSHCLRSYCNLETVQKCLCMRTDCCRESAGLGEGGFLPRGGSLTVLSLARVPTHLFQLARKWCHPPVLGRGQGGWWEPQGVGAGALSMVHCIHRRTLLAAGLIPPRAVIPLGLSWLISEVRITPLALLTLDSRMACM